MWPLPKISNDIITWIIRPTESVLTHIKTTKNNSVIRAFSKTTFNNNEYEEGRVCNLSRMQKIITQFIQHHKISHAPIYCAISGPVIHEKISSQINKDQHLYSQNCYLYNNDNQHIYYSASIDPSVILQYQCISITTEAPIAFITTPFIALLKLYTIAYENTFRHAQLAQELQQYHHRIEYCFSNEIIDHIQKKQGFTIEIENYFDLASTRYFLLISLGLFYLRR